MPSPKLWWRRAAMAVKDKQMLCLTILPYRATPSHPDMEAAIIKATSHDDLSLDYKNARRVFAWARTSPTFIHPVMFSLAHRAARTRSWPVALKSLLLAHGLLLAHSFNHLPFDLSAFRDRSSRCWGFSAFVRAYFNFLDSRAHFLANESLSLEEDCDSDCELEKVEKLQALMELLIQIRPYADGMEHVSLILETMECAMTEIFEVYSGICNGIASFLVGYMGESLPSTSERRRRRGMIGIRILRRAAEQSEKISGYMELCERLGVRNAVGLPAVETIPEEDIRVLEKLVLGGEEEKCEEGRRWTVVMGNWVVFDGVMGEAKENGRSRRVVDGLRSQSWAAIVEERGASCGDEIGNLIEL